MTAENALDELVLQMLSVGPTAVPMAALWAVDLLADADADVGEVVARLESTGAVVIGEGGLVSLTPDLDGVGNEGAPSIAGVTRSRLRGSLGRALRDSASVSPAEVATLLIDGLAVRPDPSVLPWILDSANRLLREGRLDEATATLEVAVDAMDRGLPVDPVVRVRALARLSYLLRWVGRSADAEELLDRTVATARAGTDPDELAIAAITWSPRQFAISDDPSAFALLDDALARLPDESALRPLLQACRAGALVFTDLDAARTAAVDALARARRNGDAETFLPAAYAHRVTHWHPANQARTLELANEMVARAPQAVDFAEYGPLTRLQVFLETGDFEHLDNELAAMGRRLARHPRPFETLWYTTVAAARATLRGQWDEARALTDRALALGDGATYDMGYQLLLTQSVLVAWHLGDDLTGLVDHALPAGPLRRSWEACLLGWTCTRRSADEVRSELDRLLPDGMSSIRPDLTFGPVASSLAMAAAEAGAADHAAILYEGLEPYVGQWAGTGGAVSNGPFSLHVGRLAATLGRRDDAERLLHRALEECRRAESPPWEARTELALGAAEVDVGAAAAHRSRAAAIAETFGMVEVAALAQRPVRGRTDRPGGLSSREVEVLSLLARGATNRQIADELYLSVKTVERHLLNSYRKIGARGRAEATAFAVRNGLV